MLASAYEGSERGGAKCDVEDGIRKSGIGGVAVIFPVGIAGIDFDIAMKRRCIDLNRGMAEVWASTMIPFSELSDA
jgi:hypothetical protein